MKKLIFLMLIFFSLYVKGDSWVRKADFGGSVRYGAGSFSIGNKGYIGGGEYGSPQKDFWEYDPLINTWVQKANLYQAIYFTTAFSIGNEGYMGTGGNFGATTNDFWKYDSGNNTWNTAFPFSGTSRTAATSFSIGNRGYIGTGQNDNPINTNDFWEYDSAIDAWTQIADFGGTPRFGAVGFSIGNKGYVGTGSDGTFPNDFWEYNPGTNIWIKKANFGGSGRIQAVGFSIGNKGYIGTGWNGTLLNDFWEYDPTFDSWSQKTNFGGTARNLATGFSIGTKGYIGTGYDGSSFHYKKDFWEYTPDSTTGINEFPISNFKFQIFPNPSHGSFSIQFSEAVHNPAITIYNNIGEKVFEKKEKGTVKEIPVQLKAATGIYFLKIGEEVRRIVIE